MAQPKGNKDKFYLEIDIKEAFGFDAADSPTLAESMVGDVIELIRERTLSKKNVDGEKFDNYSESYADTLEFQVYGKQQNEPNLQLTGSMLNTIDVIQRKGNDYRIGWDERVQNNKAFNHHTGDTVTQREWFAINEDELNSIRKRYKQEIDIVKKQTEPPENEALSQILDRVITLDQIRTVGTDQGGGALSNAALLSRVFSEVLFDE